MTTISLLTAIFNSLWQAAAIAGSVWLALRWLRINSATRGVIWWAALLVVVLLPFAPRVQLQRSSRPAVHAGLTETPTRVYAPIAAEPAVLMLTEKPSAQWPSFVSSIWAMLFLYKLAATARSFFYLRAVKRNATVSQLSLPGIRRRARVLLSHEIASPMAVGFFNPAVLLPHGIPDQITGDEMEQILLHESAHLARWDDWWNLLGRATGALLALHPVALWILRQIEFEREAACDDWVVARTGAVLPYAETLAHMVELRRLRGTTRLQNEALASGVFGRGSRIGDRIEMLLQRGRRFSARVSFARVAAGCVGLCCLAGASSFVPQLIAFAKTPAQPVLMAQAAPAPAAARQARAPQPAARPSFEVASVKAAFPTDYHDWIRPKIVDSQRFRARIHLKVLMDWAWNVREFQLVNYPDWVWHEFFDIEAVSARPATEAEFRQMLQVLLEERFHLKMRRETRELSVYALVVGKNGPKMLESADIKSGDGDTHIGGGKFTARGASMLVLSGILSDNLDRPVIDKTELTGHYDFDMNFDYVESTKFTPIGPALFTLVQDLGLKLEPRKVPMDVFIVESVDRPSAN